MGENLSLWTKKAKRNQKNVDSPIPSTKNTCDLSKQLNELNVITGTKSSGTQPKAIVPYKSLLVRQPPLKISSQHLGDDRSIVLTRSLDPNCREYVGS